MTVIERNPELWVESQVRQIDDCLRHPESDIHNHFNVTDMLKAYRSTLMRLKSAERFCVAARALAYYKQPLQAVITALDGWERIAYEE